MNQDRHRRILSLTWVGVSAGLLLGARVQAPLRSTIFTAQTDVG